MILFSLLRLFLCQNGKVNVGGGLGFTFLMRKEVLLGSVGFCYVRRIGCVFRVGSKILCFVPVYSSFSFLFVFVELAIKWHFNNVFC